MHYDELTGQRELPARYRNAFGRASETDARGTDARLLFVDRQIERLLREAKRLGLYDGSAVIVTAAPSSDGAAEDDAVLLVKPRAAGADPSTRSSAEDALHRALTPDRP